MQVDDAFAIKRFSSSAPSHEQLGLEGDLGIEPAAPAQPQIAPKFGAQTSWRIARARCAVVAKLRTVGDKLPAIFLQF